MKKLFLFLAVTLLAIPAFAQLNTQWSVQYNNTSGYGKDQDVINIQVSDNAGYIYATGYSNNNVATIKYSAASGNLVWSKTFNGAYNSSDIGYGIALDGLGNVYVAGSEGVPYGISDFLVIKYDTAGNFIWKRTITGTFAGGLDEAKAVTCDAAGNVYATGRVSNSSTSYDMATVKLDAAGNFIWTKILDGPGTAAGDGGLDIALDPSGNVYVAGYLSFPSSTFESAAVVKYNNAGVQQWACPPSGGSGYDNYSDILVTNTGAVYAVGSYNTGGLGINGKISRFNTATGATMFSTIYSSTGSATDEFKKLTRDPATGALYVTGQAKNNTSGNGEMLTAKYDSTGVFQWAKQYTGFATATDYGYDIAMDGSGNIWTAGFVDNGGTQHDLAVIMYNSAGTQLYADQYSNPFNSYEEAASIVYYNNAMYVGGYQTTSTTAQDYLYIKYDVLGSRTWVKTWNPPISPPDASTAVTTDAAGNIYVAGTTQVSTYYNEIFVMKYNAAGTFQWQYNYTGNSISQHDKTTGIAVDASGNVYVCGYVVNTATLKDGFIAKLNSAGAQQWTVVYNNTPNKDDAFNAIRLDASGNVFVTGYRTNSSNQTDVYTSEYSTAGVFQWGTSYTGTAGASTDWGNDLVLDGAGNTIVVGKATYSATMDDMIRIKYNSTGVQQWAYNYTTTANYDDVAKLVRQAPNGDFYCAGYRTIAGLDEDIFVMRFNASGAVSNTVSLLNNGTDEPNDMEITPTNKILLSAMYSTSSTPSGPNMGTIAFSPTLVQQWLKVQDGTSTPMNSDNGNSVAYSTVTNKIYSTGTLENGANNYKDMRLVVYDTLGNILNSVTVDNAENTNDYATDAVPDTSGNVTLVGYFGWDSDSDILLRKYCTPASLGSFTAGQVNVCPSSTGNIYTVTPSTGATSYSWTYGGTGATITGTGNSVSIDFSATATSDTLRVSAVNACGAGAALKYYVNVRPKPDVQLQLTAGENDTVCTHTITVFHPAGTGWTSLLWMPGAYTTVGNRGYYIDSAMTVTIIGTSAYGCKDTASLNNYTLPKPTAGFTSSSTTITPGGTVNYTYTGTGATIWNWSFTGGVPSTSGAANPAGITYPTAGSYQTKQVVYNSYGCKDSVTVPYYVNVSGPLPALNEIYSAAGTDLIMSDGAEAEKKYQLLAYNDGSNGYVTKIHSDGTVLWTKKFVNTHVYNVAVADSNHYYIGSTVVSSGLSFTVITMLDKNGNSIWQKKMDNSTSSTFALVDLKATKTKGCLALVEYTIGSPYNGFVVLKLDSLGTTLWQQYGYNSNSEDHYQLIETMKGDVIVVNSVYSSVSTEWASELVKFSGAGVEQWTKVISNTSFSPFNISIQEAKDSSFVIAGDDGILGPALNLMIARVDKNGNVLWMKGVNNMSLTAGYMYAGNVVLNPHGDICFLAKFEDTDVSGTVYHEKSFALFGYDKNMDTLKWNNWIQGSAYYGTPYYENLVDPILKPMNDGDFAVYTTYHDYLTGRYSPMMMRAYIDGSFNGCYQDIIAPTVYTLTPTNPAVTGLANGAFSDVESAYSTTFGTLALTKVTCSGGVITDVTDPAEEVLMKLFPNPTSDEVNVVLPQNSGTINIYNAIGSIVTSIKVGNTELKLDFSSYNSGIYLIEWRNGTMHQTSRVAKQ